LPGWLILEQVRICEGQVRLSVWERQQSRFTHR
jgi:hypothetical protein